MGQPRESSSREAEQRSSLPDLTDEDVEHAFRAATSRVIEADDINEVIPRRRTPLSALAVRNPLAPSSSPAPSPSSRPASAGPPAVSQRAPAAAAVTLSPSSALRARLVVAGGEVPLWAVVSSLALPLLLCSALVGVVTGMREGKAHPVVVVSSAAPPAKAAAPPVAAAGASIVCAAASAAAPDATPVGALGVAQVLARAEALRAGETAAAKNFAEVLSREPALISQPSLLLELGQHLARPHTAPEALRALAALQDPIGADLLYDVWTGGKKPTRVSELAGELLYSREVLSRASPALRVALDLRVAEGCEAQRPLLQRAAADGDRRALPPLAKLAWHRGCGPTKRQDCFACLRKGRELKTAIRAVKQRRAPRHMRLP